MNLVRTSFIKNKYKIVFLVCLLVLGFISGLSYYTLQNDGMKEVLISNIQLNTEFGGRINNILNHLFLFPCLIFLLMILIGLPCCLFYLYYEGLSIGFTLCLMTSAFKLKGLWLMIKYFIFFNLPYIPLLIIFCLKMVDCARNIVGLMIYKGDERIKKNLMNNLKKLLLFFIFIIILDLVIYFVSPLIFKYIITF